MAIALIIVVHLPTRYGVPRATYDPETNRNHPRVAARRTRHGLWGDFWAYHYCLPPVGHIYVVNEELPIHNNKGHSISGAEVPERPRVTRGTRPGTTGHHHHRLGSLAQPHGVTSSPESSFAPLAAYPKMVPPRGARAKSRAPRDYFHD